MTTGKGLNKVIKAKLAFPWLHSKNPKWDKYQVTVTHLSKEDAQELNDFGATIRQDDDFGYSIIVGSKEPVEVVDAQLNPITGDALRKIGNGSTANVNFTIRHGKYAKPSQNLEAIQIIDLIEYTGGSGAATAAFEVQEGYKAEASSSGFTKETVSTEGEVTFSQVTSLD